MKIPINFPKPVLASTCASRDIPIGTNIEDFKKQLLKWISECVTSRTINPQTGKSWHREKELIEDPITNDDIKKIFNYSVYGPASLRLGGLTKVNAAFDMGRLSNGQWWVRHVSFGIRGDVSWLEKPEPPVTTKRIPTFVIDSNRVNTFVIDIYTGDRLVRQIKNTVYEEAKKDASLLENPIDSEDFGLINSVLSVLPIPTSANLVYGLASGDPKGAIETVVDFGLDKVFETGGLSVLGLGKAAIGSWLQAVINGQAGDVARVRHRGYAMYIAGLLSVIISSNNSASPSGKFDKKYFQMGVAVANKLTPTERYQFQLALLQYAQQNPPSEWGIPQSQNWGFPDDYTRYYSPGLLAQSLYNQLYRSEYSVD